MIAPNPLLGTGLHAVGGVSAASCYLPFEKTKWSWESFWWVQAFFAWLIVPIVVGYFTVPNLWEVYKAAPLSAVLLPILLGAIYGPGGMAFGLAIRHIGYSLTYTISIGISATVGTMVPLFLNGTLAEQYSRPGGKLFFFGMLISMLGIVVCGMAGYRKEKDIANQSSKDTAETAQKFNMGKGLTLTVFAGILSGIFGVALFLAKPVAEIAAHNGAGHFEANASQILPSLGCFVFNIIWFTILGVKKGTIKELKPKNNESTSRYTKNLLWSALGGSMWYIQFLFLGMADVRMGRFAFAGWGIHMSMLIFFSFIVGMLMKEWKVASKRTFITLLVGLFVLLISFAVMTYGSMIGEGMV